MSDRTISLLITLDKEYRTDEILNIIDAIQMIRHIIKAEPIISDDLITQTCIRNQIRHEYLEKILSTIR